MAKQSPRSWIFNASAVFFTQHSAVTRQAQQAECSPDIAYQHAHKPMHRYLESAEPLRPR